MEFLVKNSGDQCSSKLRHQKFSLQCKRQKVLISIRELFQNGILSLSWCNGDYWTRKHYTALPSSCSTELILVQKTMPKNAAHTSLIIPLTYLWVGGIQHVLHTYLNLSYHAEWFHLWYHLAGKIGTWSNYHQLPRKSQAGVRSLFWSKNPAHHPTICRFSWLPTDKLSLLLKVI